eukprot:CAMPEP_0176029082 /NCGR_PEP_ID=MMETSP0120_2-20121206/14285_1 /TAXON_ID=160619 /ORGANISM="Kryptoperidinium foliaceum, Strain CCMP 1326" /LENGTH=141 /DNA_ID=CAMNT_0017362303 /DNA_START=43 /DNA_END=465 /DNA_ORIENTATION=+
MASPSAGFDLLGVINELLQQVAGRVPNEDLCFGKACDAIIMRKCYNSVKAVRAAINHCVQPLARDGAPQHGIPVAQHAGNPFTRTKNRDAGHPIPMAQIVQDFSSGCVPNDSPVVVPTCGHTVIGREGCGDLDRGAVSTQQ